jgi:hypothetical protein
VHALTAAADTVTAALRRLRTRLAARDAYDLAVAVLLFALAAIVLATFHSYAISNDEEVQQRYGELIIAYYRSGFTDRDLFHYSNLYLYGGLFDMLAVLTERALPFIDPYSVRHLLCAGTGIAGIAAAWATARLIAGPRAGAIAAFALAVCGPWYGSMFNHTKDIPFAAAMMGATYFLCRAARRLPRPRWTDIVAFGVLLGAALGIRVLALLLFGYAALAVLLRVRRLSANMPVRDRWDLLSRCVVVLVPAFLIGYLIMIVTWPWSALSLLNPVRGLIDFGQFNYPIDTLLDGHVYDMGNVPRWYVPVYLLIKLPPILLLGAGIALLSLFRRGDMPVRMYPSRTETALLAFTAVFPVVCEVVDRGPAFTGLRHFLFVVPPLAVLAGIGFDGVMVWLEKRRPLLEGAAAAAVSVSLVWYAAVLVRLHPYDYLYYNSLVGGLAGASGLYATDYWVNIMPEAVRDLETYVAKLDRPGAPRNSYSVAVCGERLPFERVAEPRLRWTDDWNKADFFIAPTHMKCDSALNGTVIADIKRLGAHIGVVKDRRAVVHPMLARHP